MTIKIRNLDISINTKILSGGEEIFVKRLMDKSKKGKELNSGESSFLHSMSRRSEVFSQDPVKNVKVQFFLN